MEYRGTVSHGMIQPSEPLKLPEGTEVAFHPVASQTREQSAAENGQFWRGFTLDELAREQGVAPAQALDDLAGDWPEEDDINEFLRSIREWRQ